MVRQLVVRQLVVRQLLVRLQLVGVELVRQLVVRLVVVRVELVRVELVRRLGVRRRDPVVVFVVGLFVIAGVVAVLGARVDELYRSTPLWSVAAFALLLMAAEYLFVRFEYRGEVDGLNLVEAALAPALVALPVPIVVLTVGVAQAAAAVLRRNPSRKACFNIGQWMMAAGAGGVVFAALRTGPDFRGRDLPALVGALLVVWLCNQLAFANVMRLVNRESWATTIEGLRPVMLAGWVGGWVINSGFGGLFAVAYASTTWALPFFFVPLVLLHWAGRGFATARTDRVRLGGLQQATHALAAPIDPRDGIPGFVSEVLVGFEAEAAELVTATACTRAWRNATGAVVVETLEPPVHPAPSGDCIERPVVAGERALGVLRVYGRGGTEGFADGEVAVLEALAAEAAGALQKAELLESILEERRKLFTVVDNTSDGILAIDADGIVQTWNPGLEAITGYDAQSIVGSSHVGVLRARDAAGSDVLIERWADGDADLPADIQVVASDGRPRWLSCTYSRVEAKDERAAILVVMVRDVTRIHEVERLKEDFVATVSHELRTPLTPIKGFANLLLESGERLDLDSRRAAAESILRSAQRLERLIVNLLEASRLESHVVDVRDAIVPVSTVVSQVVEEFRTAFSDRVITVHEHRAVAARGSELWIEQIVSNLLSNAVKYTHGGIEVVVRDDDGTVEIGVVDHGPGVPEHEAERIFHRFERLDQDRQQAGTGLGLYIARELAHAMNGTLAVSRGADGGAVFALRVPAAPGVLAVG
ncbi:MAG: PAS domain-containing sensor histidine kinase [Actinobacteria bacterium]|nr:PAS domain-containing sensor histidine kinase [Actinomycetota bacterium]